MSPLCQLCAISVALFATLSPATATTREVTGRVVGITDGDTLTLLDSSHQTIKVRLAEIDAPEKAQAFGQRSKQSLSDLCYGKEARVIITGKHRDRSIGRVWCAGVDTSAMQVQRGMAWVYDYYASDKALYALQNAARQVDRGLWSDPTPVRPWVWRKSKR